MTARGTTTGRVSTLAQPTTAEWTAAGVAAGLVVLLAALHLLRPVLARSPATPWGRTAGVLLGSVTTGLVLCVGVAAAAAVRAGETPEGAFAGVLVHVEPTVAERIAAYAAAILLPLSAVIAVLALAVVDLGRPSSLRIAAGVAAGMVLASGVLVVLGDTGPVATGVGWAAVVLAGAAALTLVLDELVGRQTSGPSRSEGSTSRSQRSRQSRQR